MTDNPVSETADAVYLDKLTNLPRQLVFIMGCHRSGTSMLLHLLAYTGAFEYISAYDIIKYDEILSNRIEGREESVKAALDATLRLEKTRGMDNLPVGADYPDEYGFLLNSPPSAWWLARKGPEAGRQLFAPQLIPSTLDRFLEICRKKEFLGGGDKPLVLKNPGDCYFNFAEIHRMFPEARMIFIHRHPLAVLNSLFTGFRGLVAGESAYFAMIDRRHGALLESPWIRSMIQRVFEHDQLLQGMVSALNQSYAYYLENIGGMPPDKYISLRYEDLCLDPEAHMQEIGRRLNLQITPQIPEKFVAARKLKVEARVLAAYQEQADDAREYREAFGYPLFPPELADPSTAPPTP